MCGLIKPLALFFNLDFPVYLLLGITPRHSLDFSQIFARVCYSDGGLNPWVPKSVGPHGSNSLL